jgi:hypothetical protein
LLILGTLLLPLRVGAAEPAGAPAAAGVAAAAPAGGPQPVVVRDPLYRLEFELPAPYWRAMDNRALAAEAQKAPGGCAPPQQVPDNLLFVFTDNDAPVLGRLELAERSFLLRDKAGLEAYVDARMAAIASQVGGSMQEPTSAYTMDRGLITHRIDFTAGGGGGGCAPGARGGPAMRYAIVHHFVRPKGADALLFVMYCYAPVDVFERLKPEIDFIIDSFHYTGEVDAEFFALDAPEDKLLTAKDAAKGKQGGFNWLMPVALAAIIWLMLRRKKQKPA